LFSSFGGSIVGGVMVGKLSCGMELLLLVCGGRVSSFISSLLFSWLFFIS